MRKMLLVGLAFSGGVLLLGPGCFDYMNDCNYNISLACYWDNQGGGTTTSPTCQGDPTKDAIVVRDDCGVFVKPGSVDGNGSAGKPFGTFAEAANAGGGRVFACAGDYTETEAVVFTEDVEVFGGFTGCGTEWKWSDDSRAKITGPADAIAISFDGSASALTNVDVTASDAQKDGGSSIAVLVKGGTVVWVNGDLTSGQAMAGAAGESPAADATLDGTIGQIGAAACSAGTSHPGPAGGTNTCLDGTTSVAGNGGDGGEFQAMLPVEAGSGTDGTPPDDALPTFGKGGVGEGVNASPVCIDGTSGAPGDDGAAADPVAALGDVTETGYQGAPGNTGQPGKPGQGGGGGGGSKGAKAVTDCTGMPIDVFGASGGAGGTGGCGGKGGGGGGAGGASIVLLSLAADVTLTNVTLHPGKGGAGGVGGNGQSGGQPGSGGAFGAGAGAAKKSCRGGDGGSGGPGGAGSGGTGGHAIGVAFKGAAPKAVVAMDKAAPGVGGDGGTGNEIPGKGSDGQPCKTLNFENGQCE